MEEGGGSLGGECRHAWPIRGRQWKPFPPSSHPHLFSIASHIHQIFPLQNTLFLNRRAEGYAGLVVSFGRHFFLMNIDITIKKNNTGSQ